MEDTLEKQYVTRKDNLICSNTPQQQAFSILGPRNSLPYHTHKSSEIHTSARIMAGKKAGGENTKKAAGNAKKAEAAAAKAAVADAHKSAAEEKDWGKGAKDNSKK